MVSLALYLIPYCSTGDACDEDTDGCATLPCLDLQDCTDMSAADHNQTGRGYSCGKCPQGFYNIANVSCGGKNNSTSGSKDREILEQPIKHETLNQCWCNVEPSSATLAQQSTNISCTSRVCWEV